MTVATARDCAPSANETKRSSAARRSTPRAEDGARPKLLFIVNDTAFFASHRLPIGRAAVARGFEVHLAALVDGREAEILDAGIQIHPLPVDRTGLSPAKDARLFGTICRLIRRLRPDLVHNVTIKPVLYGAMAARLCGVPAVVNAISGLGYVFEGTSGARRLLRHAVQAAYRVALAHPNSVVIFQNRESREHFLRARLTVASKAALIRGSGVDVASYLPSPEPAGEPVVLFPARLLRAKGVNEFVEAGRRLRAAGIPARFVLAGGIPAHNPDAVAPETVEGWVRQGLVEWLGHCDNMPARFAASHIVCLPSFYYEGLPKALAEAAAAGRPIVTTHTPGCNDVVIDGVNGRLVPPRDVDALVRALQSLLTDPAARHRMGAAGRLRAVAEFSVQGVVERSLAVYGSVLAPEVSSRPAWREIFSRRWNAMTADTALDRASGD